MRCMGCRCVYRCTFERPWCPRCGALPWYRALAGEVLEGLEPDQRPSHDYYPRARLEAPRDCQRCGVPLRGGLFCNDCRPFDNVTPSLWRGWSASV